MFIIFSLSGNTEFNDISLQSVQPALDLCYSKSHLFIYSANIAGDEWFQNNHYVYLTAASKIWDYHTFNSRSICRDWFQLGVDCVLWTRTPDTYRKVCIQIHPCLQTGQVVNRLRLGKLRTRRPRILVAANIRQRTRWQWAVYCGEEIACRFCENVVYKTSRHTTEWHAAVWDTSRGHTTGWHAASQTYDRLTRRNVETQQSDTPQGSEAAGWNVNNDYK